MSPTAAVPKSRASHRSLWITLALLVVLGGGAFAFWKKSQPDAPSVSARRGDIVEAVYGLGTVVSARVYHAKVGIVQKIAAIHVKEGDAVAKGAALLTLDDAVVIRAPFAGTITSIPFRTGENVFPQMPLITVTDLTDRYVSVSLEQEGALRVTRGQTVRVAFESIRSEVFTGSVQSIFPSDGQFIVHVDVSGLPAGVLPGMTADVAIQVAKRENALLIPVAAVANGKVTVIRDGHQTKTAVKMGAIDGQWAEILGTEVKEDDTFLIRTK